MKATVVLDPDYGTRHDADPGPVFWMVESADNRALAERLWLSQDCDPNSAVFKGERFKSPVEAASSIFLNVAEHHPGCTEVEFIGAVADDAMCHAFEEMGIAIAPTVNGFLASPVPLR